MDGIVKATPRKKMFPGQEDVMDAVTGRPTGQSASYDPLSSQTMTPRSYPATQTSLLKPVPAFEKSPVDTIRPVMESAPKATPRKKMQDQYDPLSSPIASPQEYATAVSPAPSIPKIPLLQPEQQTNRLLAVSPLLRDPNTARYEQSGKITTDPITRVSQVPMATAPADPSLIPTKTSPVAPATSVPAATSSVAAKPATPQVGPIAKTMGDASNPVSAAIKGSGQQPRPSAPEGFTPGPSFSTQPGTTFFKSALGTPMGINTNDPSIMRQYPNSVATDANGIPVGQRMVPVSGVDRGQAFVGVKDTSPTNAQAATKDDINSTPSLLQKAVDKARVFSGSVDTPALSNAQQEASDRYNQSIKSGFGTPAERATKQARQNYDLFGRPVEQAHVADESRLLGEKFAGMAGVETEKTKGEMAQAEAARTYKQAESEKDRAFREESEIRRMYDASGRVATQRDLAQAKQVSSNWNSAMGRAAKALEPAKAIAELAAIANEADRMGFPAAQQYFETIVDEYAMPYVNALAPKATDDQKAKIANALVLVGGDLSKLPPGMQALLQTAKK